MIRYEDNQTLVRLSTGELWHFYHKKNNGIEYRTLLHSGTWSKEKTLAREALKDFSLDVDSQDRIHVIYQTRNGELKYMRYNGHSWGNQVLSTYDPLQYIIHYPTIIIAGQLIHIIFALGTAFNVGIWTLFHYYWNGSAWSQYEICKFTGGKQISPFQVDIGNGELYLCYRGLDENRYQIFYTHFIEGFSIWSGPDRISSSDQDCAYPALLADKKGNVHFVWNTLVQSNLHIQYTMRNAFPHKAGHPTIKREITLSSGHSNCFHPILTILENQLWALWIQGDQIMGTVLNNQRDEWSKPEPLTQDSLLRLNLYRYISNISEEQNTIKSNYIFANLENPYTVILLKDMLKLPLSSVSHELAESDSTPEILTGEKSWEHNSESDSPEKQVSEEARNNDQENLHPKVEEKERSAEISPVRENTEQDTSVIIEHETPKENSQSSQYLADLLKEIDRISTIKNRLEEILTEIENGEDRYFDLSSLQKRMDSWESQFFSLRREIDESLQKIKNSEAELQLLSASLRNLEEEYLSMRGSLEHYKEKSLLKKVLSRLRNI